MIVRQFLHWLRTAPAGDRADATSALARAYLYSDLSADDRIAAEGAMIMLLDDPSPLVRRALAEALAASDRAPPPVILGLASDQPDIAAIVLERSPLLLDADLVDYVAEGSAAVQMAIARRPGVPCPVAAAIAEVGSAEACLEMLENPHCELVAFSLDRIVERFGHLGAIREAVLAIEGLPVATRQSLVTKLSESLANFVTARDWIGPERAQRIAKEAVEKATLVLAADSAPVEVRPLIRHLRASGQLTAGLVLRALLSGNVALFEEALAELSGIPLARVAGIVHDTRGAGFRALYDKAGLPDAIYPAFRAAIDALREEGFVDTPAGAIRLKRRVIERVLSGCEQDALSDDIEPLLTLLRRYAAEAAREEARLFCEDLIASDALPPVEERMIAA